MKLFNPFNKIKRCRPVKGRKKRLVLESLEDRQLLSGVAIPQVHTGGYAIGTSTTESAVVQPLVMHAATNERDCLDGNDRNRCGCPIDEYLDCGRPVDYWKIPPASATLSRRRNQAARPSRRRQR